MAAKTVFMRFYNQKELIVIITIKSERTRKHKAVDWTL